MSRCTSRCVRDPEDVAQTCHRAAGSRFLNGDSAATLISIICPWPRLEIQRKAEKKQNRMSKLLYCGGRLE